MDEKELRKFLAENGVPRTPVQDKINTALIEERRNATHKVADATVSAFLELCEGYNFCTSARRYVAARLILALSAKLNDIDDPNPLDLNDRNQLDARLFKTRANFDDLVDLAASLIDSGGEHLRAKITQKDKE